MKNLFKKLIIVGSGVSSKRLAGLTGWGMVLFISLWCDLNVTVAPALASELLWGSVALLSTDAVTKIWRKKEKPKDDCENEEEER